MKNSYPVYILLILLSLDFLPVHATSSDSIRILAADDPAECLFLEGIFTDGDGYFLIDGRNNTGRVKRVNSEGLITGGILSTIPLPDAASLPGDILPSPWGLDRVIPSGEFLWSIPAPWAGSVAEKFDLNTGALIERLDDLGTRSNGLATGPNGNIWAISRRLLVNITSGNLEALNLGGNLQHIDNAVGHPLGFIVLQQPDLMLVEPSGLIRWRNSLDGSDNFFISPTDIACGADGTTAVCGIVADLSDPENLAEYNALREESLARDDEDVLFALEDALRSNLGIGYILLLIDASGTITDVIELNTPPISCAVDSSGRAHILSEVPDGWAVSILDPRLDEGFNVIEIPFGTPTLIAPHRIETGGDGSLYWDDVIAAETGELWGIAKLAPSRQDRVFSLGTGNRTASAVSWVYREPAGNYVRQTSALSVDSIGDLWIGVQDFSYDIINDPTMEFIDQMEAPYSSNLLHVNRDGNLISNSSSQDIVGVVSPAVEIHSGLNHTLGFWAGMNVGNPFRQFENNTWIPLPGINFPDYLMNARIGDSGDGYISWINYPDGEYTSTAWYSIRSDLSGISEIPRFSALEARFLECDRITGQLWITIDDGEIFQIDSNNMRVTGIWNNRLPSGAPGHPLDDAAKIADGLAILDREHRAIFLLEPEAFEEPGLAIQSDVDDAINAIRAAFQEARDQYGLYPPPSLDLLYRILEYSEQDIVRRAFLGGRIYDYKLTETGYSFIAWSATAEQTVLLVDDFNTQVVY